MKKIKSVFFVFIGTLFFSSCYIQHPKYTMVEKVVRLETGISVDSVNSILNLKPHDLISLDSTGRMVLLYKYRVREIKRIPILMKRTKGLKTDGHWRDLLVNVSPEGIVTNYSSMAEEQSSEKEKVKVDPNEIIQSITLALTVIIPSLLVYFSSK
jgi:hypothetical protein